MEVSLTGCKAGAAPRLSLHVGLHTQSATLARSLAITSHEEVWREKGLAIIHRQAVHRPRFGIVSLLTRGWPFRRQAFQKFFLQMTSTHSESFKEKSRML